MFRPVSLSAPAPALVSVKAEGPAMLPFSVSWLAATVIVRLAPRVIAPVFCVRLAVPAKVRLAPSVRALVIVASRAASSVPPLTVSVPTVVPLPPKA